MNDKAPLIRKQQEMPATMDTQSFGSLRINVNSSVRNLPLENINISISYTDEPGRTIGNFTTNNNGQTESIELPAPALEYSLEPSVERPYSEYTLAVTGTGFEPVVISGCEILPTTQAFQQVTLDPAPENAENTAELYVIPDHTLYGDYPPPIIEDEVKPVNESGEIVLSSVVIPEFVVVHDGPPSSNAKDYYVRYRDYIKNVASSEIYATWPTATIYANILAIQSFTLNRVYTEWYRTPYFFRRKFIEAYP